MLQLTKSEIESVMDYIWIHCRASTEGKAYKTWVKMFEFVNGERPAAPCGLGQGALFAGLPDVLDSPTGEGVTVINNDVGVKKRPSPFI